MKISKLEFENIFKSVSEKTQSDFYANIQKTLADYSDNGNNLSADKIALFAFSESVAYSERFVYTLLTRLLFEE